jgi:predicted DNA-binding protein
MTKQFQLRIAPELHEKIKFFAELEGETMTQLAIEALEAHTRRLARLQEGRLAETLARIRRYRDDASHLDRDLQAFVDAELDQDDPFEGAPAPAQDERDVAGKDNPVSNRVLAKFADLGR